MYKTLVIYSYTSLPKALQQNNLTWTVAVSIRTWTYKQATAWKIHYLIYYGIISAMQLSVCTVALNYFHCSLFSSYRALNKHAQESESRVSLR